MRRTVPYTNQNEGFSGGKEEMTQQASSRLSVYSLQMLRLQMPSNSGTLLYGKNISVSLHHIHFSVRFAWRMITLLAIIQRAWDGSKFG